MKTKTLEALKGSIEKWEAIVAGHGVDSGPSNCPLCVLFLKRPSFGAVCSGCPVHQESGHDGCESTPYEDWANYAHRNGKWKVFDAQSKRLAQAELDYLKSLLPYETQDSAAL